MYTGYFIAGASASVRLDRRMVRYESGRCPGLRAENAGRDKRESAAEKSNKRETRDSLELQSLVGALLSKVSDAVESVLVLLVIAQAPCIHRLANLGSVFESVQV